MVCTMSRKTRVVKLRQLVMGWTPLKLKPEPRHSSAESAKSGEWGAVATPRTFGGEVGPWGPPSPRLGACLWLPPLSLSLRGLSLIGSQKSNLCPDALSLSGNGRALFLPDAPHPCHQGRTLRQSLAPPRPWHPSLPQVSLWPILSPAPRPGVTLWGQAGVRCRGLLDCRPNQKPLGLFLPLPQDEETGMIS